MKHIAACAALVASLAARAGSSRAADLPPSNAPGAGPAAAAVDARSAGATPPLYSGAKRLMNSDDFFHLVTLSDPEVSPDGAWVAYVVARNDRQADTAHSAIWMVSWDGDQRLQLSTPGEATSKPHWSPDGRLLAFIAQPAGADKPQILLLDRRGGEAQPLTSVGGQISDFAWSPDSKRIALVMTSDDAAADKAPRPIVIDALHFKQDEQGYLDASQRRHVYLLDVETRRLDPLLADAGQDEDSPAWSPDGGHIVFSRTREPGADSDGRAALDIVEARAGAVPSTVTRAYAPNLQKLRWSPDGRSIIFTQGAEPRFNAYMQDQLCIVSVAGGSARSLTGVLDRAVMGYEFTAADSIVAIVEDDRSEYAARIDAVHGVINRAKAPEPEVVSAVSSRAGHTAVLRASDAEPAEIFALDGGQLRRLTAHNDAWLATIRLGAAEDMQFRSKDGTEVHGILVKPPDYVAGRRYPAVLWIHGGPSGQDEHALVLDGYQFEAQMFAAQGYVVLRVNYRGGSGRGIAYAKAIVADWGHKEVEDLLAGVDALVARGIADKARLAVGGWSYGAILTDYVIASDRRFHAAISGAGSGNQLSTYGSDQYILQYRNELGDPWRNPSAWIKVSYPFFHADRIGTPTLFVGGSKDFNVPIIGGEQMYQALRVLGVPAQLVVYPDQNHVFSRPSFIKDLADRMLTWLARYVPPTVPPGN